MKKFIFLLLIFLSTFRNYVQATSVDFEKYIAELKTYGTEIFSEIYEEDFIEDLSNGTIKLNNRNFVEKLLDVFIKEIRTSIQLVFKIFTICIFCAIIKNLQSSNENGVSEAAFYVCYLVVVSLIMTNFINIADLCKDTVNTLNAFMGILIPILIIYLSISGHIVIVSTLQPILVGMISVISNIISNLLIPIILITTILNIVSNISNEVDVSKISSLLKKTTLFVLEISLIIFIGILSLEGSLAANVDGIVAKTAKSIVSTTIPVVGKLVGDATDSVIGATSITKNAIRFFGSFNYSFNMCCAFYKVANNDDNI